tara:strand:+ start:1192 stop:2001 length:810 start_codon:yes stop_codon:yes gene_type:complete
MVELPRTPRNPNEAAAFTMIAMLRIGQALSIWGCFLITLLPDRAFLPFRVVHRLLAFRRRRLIMLLWHLGSATVAALMTLATAGGLLIHVSHKRMHSLNEFLCQNDALQGTYSDNKLTGAVTATVFLAFLRLSGDRCVCVLCGAKSVSRVTRFGRSADAAALWFLLADGSPLAALHAVVTNAEWCLCRTLDAMRMSKRFSELTLHRCSKMRGLLLLAAACLLMHSGGQTHRDECNASKRNASLVVMHSSLWCLSLIREFLKEWLVSKEI